MLNHRTGKDDVKYYAMTLVMADHMESGTEEQRRFRELSLARLADAVNDEVRFRRRNRDVDLGAATRVRSQW